MQMQRINRPLSPLKNLLSCNICCNSLTNPTQIQCGHVFCSMCVEKIQKPQASTGTRLANCPLCKVRVNRRALKLRKDIVELAKEAEIFIDLFLQETDKVQGVTLPGPVSVDMSTNDDEKVDKLQGVTPPVPVGVDMSKTDDKKKGDKHREKDFRMSVGMSKRDDNKKVDKQREEEVVLFLQETDKHQGVTLPVPMDVDMSKTDDKKKVDKHKEKDSRMSVDMSKSDDKKRGDKHRERDFRMSVGMSKRDDEKVDKQREEEVVLFLQETDKHQGVTLPVPMDVDMSKTDDKKKVDKHREEDSRMSVVMSKSDEKKQVDKHGDEDPSMSVDMRDNNKKVDKHMEEDSRKMSQPVRSGIGIEDIFVDLVKNPRAGEKNRDLEEIDVPLDLSSRINRPKTVPVFRCILNFIEPCDLSMKSTYRPETSLQLNRATVPYSNFEKRSSSSSKAYERISSNKPTLPLENETGEAVSNAFSIGKRLMSAPSPHPHPQNKGLSQHPLSLAIEPEPQELHQVQLNLPVVTDEFNEFPHDSFFEGDIMLTPRFSSHSTTAAVVSSPSLKKRPLSLGSVDEGDRSDKRTKLAESANSDIVFIEQNFNTADTYFSGDDMDNNDDDLNMEKDEIFEKEQVPTKSDQDGEDSESECSFIAATPSQPNNNKRQVMQPPPTKAAVEVHPTTGEEELRSKSLSDKGSNVSTKSDFPTDSDCFLGAVEEPIYSIKDKDTNLISPVRKESGDKEKATSELNPGKVISSSNEKETVTKIHENSHVSAPEDAFQDSFNQFNQLELDDLENQIPVKNYVFCATRLTKSQMSKLGELCKMCDGTITKDYTEEVTHLILNLEINRVPQTMKYFFAIADKKWIVTFGWVDACLEHNSMVCEEPFETSNFPECDTGVQKSRTTASSLFDGISFYFAGPLRSSGATLEDCMKLVAKLGGRIVKFPKKENGNVMIIGDALYCTNYQEWYKTKGWLTVSWDWILDCILTFRVIPFLKGHLLTTLDKKGLSKAALPPALLDLNINSPKMIAYYNE